MKNVILKIELDHAHGIDNNEQKKRENHRINFVFIGLDKKRDSYKGCITKKEDGKILSY